MQRSVRTVLPCSVCPVLLPDFRLDGHAHHRGRAAASHRVAGLDHDTRTRLEGVHSQLNNQSTTSCLSGNHVSH
ncbi:hypothetical protein [Phocaeicola sp.]|uniref:hypothetical protein n=1 Tax=Phocaeicola sp. TaxID=2773926 RepID=UPI002A82C9C9|nr:hypothetical protein [Phocaeicola sp.]